MQGIRNDYPVICKDLMRIAIAGNKKRFWTDKNRTEPLLHKMRNEVLNRAFAYAKDQISPEIYFCDTNLYIDDIKQMMQAAYRNDVEVKPELITFDVPLEELLRRNAKRDPDDVVPERVVIENYLTYTDPKHWRFNQVECGLWETSRLLRKATQPGCWV